MQAASLPETFFTVWRMCSILVALGAGKSDSKAVLLMQSGASGVGMTAIRRAHAPGHLVSAIAGNARKCVAYEVLGDKRELNYKTENFVTIIKLLTHDRGVDVILDMVGGSYINHELNTLAGGERILLIALFRGSKAQLNLSKILHRNLIITGSMLRPRLVNFKAAISAQLYKRV